MYSLRKLREYLQEKAESTFLWVTLVCKMFQHIQIGKTKSDVTGFPPGLEPLYKRMMEQVQDVEAWKDEEDVGFCKRILSSITLAYQPIHLNELAGIAGLPEEQPDHLHELVDRCCSFLTVRSDIIYFIHQSAKDYFTAGKGSKIFSLSQAEEHYRIAYQSLEVMSKTLKRDICNLRVPGALLTNASNIINQDL